MASCWTFASDHSCYKPSLTVVSCCKQTAMVATCCSQSSSAVETGQLLAIFSLVLLLRKWYYTIHTPSVVQTEHRTTA